MKTIRELTEQDGARIPEKCGARLCIPNLTRHVFVILPSCCVSSLLLEREKGKQLHRSIKYTIDGPSAKMVLKDWERKRFDWLNYISLTLTHHSWESFFRADKGSESLDRQPLSQGLSTLFVSSSFHFTTFYTTDMCRLMSVTW